MKSSKKAATTLSTACISFAVGMLKTVALCVIASCSQTVIRHEARPIEAVLEIRVGDQWQTVQRVRYQYEKPMDEWQSLPVAELERILRERESAGVFDGETTALRVLIERRRAGLKD